MNFAFSFTICIFLSSTFFNKINYGNSENPEFFLTPVGTWPGTTVNHDTGLWFEKWGGLVIGAFKTRVLAVSSAYRETSYHDPEVFPTRLPGSPSVAACL